jgi:hypothetical protein
MLGSGTNVAYLYDRGGTNRIAPLILPETIKWGRVRDGISEASLKFVTPTGACAEALSQIAVGRHEIVIFRDGERKWEGPITRTAHTRSSVQIEASDICHYLSRTAMRKAYDNRYSAKKSKVALVTTRMSNILLSELARKEAQVPPINVLPHLTVKSLKNGAKTARFTHAYQRTVWEEMDSLAWRAGMDYTVVGRRLILNDVHDPLGITPILSQGHFGEDLIVTAYGMELGTRSIVSDGEGHWAAVGGSHPFYGEVELLHDLYDVSMRPANPAKPTKAELRALTGALTSQAQRNLAGRYPVPVVARIPDNSPLSPNAPLTIDDLVPGVRIPLRAQMAALTIEQEQKLDKVTVFQDKDGEKISVTLSPSPGTAPWDDETETSGDDIGDFEV